MLLTVDMLKFLKDWMLPLAMAGGASLYLVYSSIPALAPAGPFLERAVAILQPLLLSLMIFLTFCRIAPKEMRPRKWHLPLLLFQAVSFTLGAVVLILMPDTHATVLIESAMICLICPTATAAAVVTGRLGGDIAGITSYTVLINLVTAVLVPLLVPVVHPHEGVTFFAAFSMVLVKVFSLLIFPCLLAWIVRYLMPKMHRRLVRNVNVPFYLWGVSLCLAIAVTTRSIVNSTVPVKYMIGIAAISALCCCIQFIFGKAVGRGKGDSVTAGQSLGQKNTVFAIWMGYTFMTPVTSVAGGFYSVWHNLFNSWQLYRKRKDEEKGI